MEGFYDIAGKATVFEVTTTAEQTLALFLMFTGPCIVNQCQQLSNKTRLCTVYNISVNCSTCFEWYLHPSSGAHITVITASGVGQTSENTVHISHL
jgi:hypothetical protein